MGFNTQKIISLVLVLLRGILGVSNGTPKCDCNCGHDSDVPLDSSKKRSSSDPRNVDSRDRARRVSLSDTTRDVD